MKKLLRRILLGAIPILLIAAAVACFRTDWHQHKIDVNGTNRRYLFYAPSNPNRETLPLLFAYHGFSGTAERMRRSSQLHELVDKHQFYLAYLDGDPTWHRPRPGRPCPDVQFFDELCDHLEQQFPIDPNRIYVTGMSMGGDFVIRLGGLRSQRIAAVASQAMVTESAVDAERPFPLLIIVGTEDDRVPLNVFPAVPDAFRERGHEVKVVRPKGVGHWWHVPLNEDLWAFLSAHELRQPAKTQDLSQLPQTSARSQ